MTEVRGSALKMQSRKQKPQFADWLIEQVLTGQYAGLYFVDNNKFRVPWKHISRKDCCEDDSKIFRAWAVVSGKINTHPNDKAKWKINFRCILNNLTKRFMMVEDHSKDLDDPHKVYLIMNQDALLNLPAAQPSLWDLEITISYRRREMLKTQVSVPRVQLHYQCDAPEYNAQTLCFPSTDGLLDHKQIEYTNHILRSIQRGLLLEVQNTGIYGYRQDKCHVFSSTSDPREANVNPRKIPQNEMVQLLSFDKYMSELIAFKENRGGSPDYTIHMCFGEKFPDGKPLEKKLIIVKVVPLICCHFHEVAQGEGASSLQNDNISLQISHHNSLMELISATWPDGPEHTMGQYF